MTWKIKLICLIVAFSSRCARGETKKAMIIAVDELHPEKSDVIISDLTIKDGSISPHYERSESTRILKRAPFDKKPDYILVSPEDLKDLKELQLDGVTIDKPKILRYPDSGSEESRESPNTYTSYSKPPESYPIAGRRAVSKYPLKPAPPLATYPVGDSSNEKHTGQSPHLHEEYRTYISSDDNRYQVKPSDNAPKTTGVIGDYSSVYNNNKFVNNQNPSGYTTHNRYINAHPSAYTGYSGYSPPSNTYGRPNLNSYSGHGNIGKFNNEPYIYYGAAKPLGYPLPPSHYSSLSYATDKPSSYSVPSKYDIPKVNGYHNPPIYSSVKKNSYPEYSTYENSKKNRITQTENYKNSNPSTYLSRPVKPKTLKESSVYESSKHNSVSGSPNHKNSYSSEYFDPHEYENPENKYRKSKPNSHSVSSTYSHSGKTYSLSKPTSFSRPSSYSSPTTSHHDSSSEKLYPGSEKYSSHPEEYDYFEKTHPHDKYIPSNHPSEVPEYKNHRHYSSTKPIRKGYYDSPSVKHVSYDDLPTPYKTPTSSYEHTDSESSEHAHHDDESPSKPAIRKGHYHHLPYDNQYISKPLYQKNDKYGYDTTYKPRSTYNSRPSAQSKHSRPDISDETLKTSYEPSSYDEPIKSHTKYRYPSSKVTYDSNLPYKNSYSTSPSLNGDYPGNAEYKSSLVYSSHDDVSLNDNRNHDSEYGSRYPISYRKTRHTDSKIPYSSHFIYENDRLEDEIFKYKNKPKIAITEPEDYYEHNDDSSEALNHHSVKKNYSSVRPAPLQDELYQPRYPPLPTRTKVGENKKYYDEEEDTSKDSNENYKPEPSVTAVKSYNPRLHSNAQSPNTLYPPATFGKKEIISPSNNGMLPSDTSEVATDPLSYSKESREIYMKPEKDETSTHFYSSDNSDKISHEPYTFGHSKKRGENMLNDNVRSQPQYSRTKQKDSSTSPIHFIHSFSYKGKENGNISLPETFISLSEKFPQKRVPGVVYRTRHTYPNVKSFKRTKGYLSYKPFYTKSIPALDNKPYESIPAEVRNKNVTKDTLNYNLPRKMSSKSNNKPYNKHIKYRTSELEDQSYDKTEKNSHHAIPGEPGKDYPVLKEIPYTQFSCEDKLPGFYADVDNQCQVYYQCSEEGRLQSFLCPNGTIFNQATFVCEWWHNVNCSKSEKYFGKNNQLYKLENPLPSVSKSKRRAKEDYNFRELDSPSSYEALKLYT